VVRAISLPSAPVVGSRGSVHYYGVKPHPLEGLVSGFLASFRAVSNRRDPHTPLLRTLVYKPTLAIGDLSLDPLTGTDKVLQQNHSLGGWDAPPLPNV
jgi:hypothetical protein